MQTWLITGCSTGFGRELALAVLARGWHAAVTARNPADIADIAAAHPERSLALKLDVRERGEIAEAVERCPARSCTSRRLQPERWMLRAATMMKLRRPECDEQPS